MIVIMNNYYKINLRKHNKKYIKKAKQNFKYLI